MKIDLNSDLGESWGTYTKGEDGDVLKIITSANIACGYHAGDPLVMTKTVKTAIENNVSIGAHPSFMDLQGFGRRRLIGDSIAEIERQIAYQIGALQGIAARCGASVTHVKCHGALGNIIAEDQEMANAVARAVKSVDSNLILIVMPNMATERAADRYGLRMAKEIYADRNYLDNGNLVPRSEPQAIIHDAEQAAARVIQMLNNKTITSISGQKISMNVDTVCVHGDNPAAVVMAKKIRQVIIGNGFELCGFNQFVD